MNEKSLRVLEYLKIKDMLVSLCVSEAAKHWAMALMPSRDASEVTHWQAETTEAQRVMLKAGQLHIGRIHGIEPSLKLAEIGSTLYHRALLEIGDTLRTARLLKGFVERQQDEALVLPILMGHAGYIGTFKALEETIERCIMSDTEMSDDASPKLKSIRKTIESKHQQIRSRLDKIITSDAMQRFLQDALVTIRQDRFVIPVKAEHKSHIKGLVHDQSASGATFYIEPLEIVELNNQLKELDIEEKREIERILKEITGQVAHAVDAIRATYHAVIALDQIFAKGKLSLQMKGSEPGINKTMSIRIRKGKHPLIPQDVVVPTDFHMGEDFQSLLITGPNTGGKTVTLKTVGLFALMCQSGLHLPAEEGTRFPIFDAVYADIGDEQSIEQSLSTFSSHMRNIVDILQHVDKRSLVLFDELGAGTDPTEGAALAMAILSYVRKKGALSVATTHYSELKQFALVNEGFENASVEFNVETLSPTYRLLIGVPGKSNAYEISRKLGLDDHIIESAKRFVDTESVAFEDILNAIDANRKQSEAFRLETEQINRDAQTLKRRMQQEEQKIKEQRDKVVNQAKAEARELLKRAKEEADSLVKELREMRAHASVDNKRLETIRKDLKEKTQALADNIIKDAVDAGEVPEQLKLGMEVFLTTLGQPGSIVALPDDKQMVQVQVGIMRTSVPLASLRTYYTPEQPKPSKFSPARRQDKSKADASKTVSVRSELDLRGQNLEEAIQALDQYLDHAVRSSLQQVCIIHGMGTGVLKKGVTDFMRRHSHVKSQRPGEYGEGGAGVTIVTLK